MISVSIKEGTHATEYDWLRPVAVGSIESTSDRASSEDCERWYKVAHANTESVAFVQSKRHIRIYNMEC